MIPWRIKRFVLFFPMVIHQRGWSRLALLLVHIGLKWDPDHGDLLHQKGRILLDVGQSEKSVEVLNRASKNRSENPFILSTFGRALMVSGDYQSAALVFEKAIQMKPDLLGALVNLGNAHILMGQPMAAVVAYERVLKSAPDLAGIHYNLGSVFADLERVDDAAACFRQAVHHIPSMYHSQHKLGLSLIILGQLQEAQEVLQEALWHHPQGIEIACSLAKAKGYVVEESMLHRMEAMLEHCPEEGEGAREESDRIVLAFALAQIYLKQDKWDQAFDCFSRANREKRATFHFDLTEERVRIRRIVAFFDEAFFARMRGVGIRDETPVFILGMPRSGTTLVEQMLAAHPQVYGAGERLDIYWLADGLAMVTGGELGFPEAVEALTLDVIRDLGLAYVAGLRIQDPSALRITDKLPHNFLFVGLIHVMFPHARIIHCRRDPVDTCLSCYMEIFVGTHDYAYDLGELGAYYQLYHTLMEHWHQVLPGRILDIEYEQLVMDPEKGIRTMLDYCGLGWDEACLNFHTIQRPIRTASLVQVRQPLYTTSVGRWRKYQSYLKPLLEALGPLVPEVVPAKVEKIHGG